MKTITSAGGPYAILDHANFQSWGANVKKSFSVAKSPFPDDYEAAGDLTDGRSHPPCHIAKLMGEKAEMLLISMPYEIAIIEASETRVHLAQIEYAEPDWSFSQLSSNEFDDADFEESIRFSSDGALYTIFDSAYLPNEIGEDCLQFSLISGEYTFSATYIADHIKGIFFYKIDRTSQLS